MGPDLNQLYAFSRRRHLVSSLRILMQVEVRHTDRTVIREDQLFQRTLSITEKNGHSLFSDGENSTSLATWVAIIKDPILLAGDILLQNRRERRVRQITAQLLRGADDRHPRATLPGIRFQHDRKLQPMPPHEFLSFSKALGGCSTCQQSGRGQPFSGVLQLFQDLILGLAHESARRTRWN